MHHITMTPFRNTWKTDHFVNIYIHISSLEEPQNIIIKKEYIWYSPFMLWLK